MRRLVLVLCLCACDSSTRGRDPNRMTQVVDLGMPAPTAPPEICGNHLDDSGNQLVDEGCPCTLDETAPCWPGTILRRGLGACRDGRQTCQQFGEFISWGACEGAVLPHAEISGNGIDEDCDGQDPGSTCTGYEVPEACGNGGDDDCDGLTDCKDPDCASACPSCAARETLCTGGNDEDCDGFVDCLDSDCTADAACKRPTTTGCSAQFPFVIEIACGDGADNDCDGKKDCDDSDCRKPGSCGCANSETACVDGKDEDCDGSTDCADIDCQKCTPGSKRWCDDPMYCHWGEQLCGPDGKWGTCVEVMSAPPGCGGTAYNATCCVNAGQCCENYPKDHASIGTCGGIVSCAVM